MKQIKVVLAGLGFGSCFLPIYLDHPNVHSVGILDTNEEKLNQMKADYPDVQMYHSLEEVLADETVDAVHLVTPIPYHADQTVAVLDSGKHCACTVPMATSLEDIRRIVEAKQRGGKNYMMMETTLYTYQFFYVKEMLERGELGRIQFLRGCHYQDMTGWPWYWDGLPPMWYGTHTSDPEVAGIDDAYLFCEDLLVAPIAAGLGDTRKIYLPAGNWVDFFTEEPVAPGWHTVTTEGIPVYRKVSE